MVIDFRFKSKIYYLKPYQYLYFLFHLDMKLILLFDYYGYFNYLYSSNRNK